MRCASRTIPMLLKIEADHQKDFCVESLWVGEGLSVVVSTAAFHAKVQGSFAGLGGSKETQLFLLHPLLGLKLSIVETLRVGEVACSASNFQGLNFESCV